MVEYIKLEENEAAGTQSFGLVREVYERAIANIHRFRKTILASIHYIWIKYALFEELLAGDHDDTGSSSERCKQVTKCVKSHSSQSVYIGKIWILMQFLIRQRDIKGARLSFGEALGGVQKELLRITSN
ncbi:putative tetratricopeptide-like helical domain superfamily [Plasmopara halstedii]